MKSYLVLCIVIKNESEDTLGLKVIPPSTRIHTAKGENILQDLSYEYDGFSNLASRTDNKRNLEERFTYDHLNRLTGIWLGNNRTGWMDYDAYGRMAGKTIDNIVVFANAEYDATAKPHAIDYADVDAGSFSEQAVTYTCFDKVVRLQQVCTNISIMAQNHQLQYTNVFIIKTVLWENTSYLS